MDCRHGAIFVLFIAATAAVGCSSTSHSAARTTFPAGARYGTESRPTDYPPQNRLPTPPPQMARNQMVAAPGVTGGALRPPEMIPTPRPDVAANGVPPGQIPEMIPAPRPDARPVQPPVLTGGPQMPPAPVMTAPPVQANPVRKWRGFLPSHDSDEDRPGWWTPDYRSGTSD